MNNVHSIQSGMKWLAFGLALYFFCAIFSSSVPLIAVLVGLVGVYKLRTASSKSTLLMRATLLLVVYYVILYARDVHLWFIEKPGILELVLGTGLKLFFLYAILHVLEELASTETDRLLIMERRGTIFALSLLYFAIQPFVLNVEFHTAMYIFIGCILLSAVILSLLVHLIVRVSSNVDEKTLPIPTAKKPIKISMNVIMFLFHVTTIIISTYIFDKYEFIEPLSQIFVINIFLGILIIFQFRVYTSFERKPFMRYFPIIYFSAMLVGIIIVTITIPKYTYSEAVAIIEKNHDEFVSEPEKYEKKVQMNHYYIYTSDQVYIFNVHTGDYAARERFIQ